MPIVGEAGLLIVPETQAFGAELTAQAEAATAEAASVIEAGLSEAGLAAGTEAGAGLSSGLSAGVAAAATEASGVLEVSMADAGVAAGATAGQGFAAGYVAGVEAAGAEASGVLTAALAASGAEAGAIAGAEAGAGVVAGVEASTPAIAAIGGVVGTELGAGVASGFKLASAAGPAALAAIGLAIGVKLTEGFIHAADETEAANIKLQQSLILNPRAADLSVASYDDLAHRLQGVAGQTDESFKLAAASMANFGLSGQQIQRALPVISDMAIKLGMDVPAAAQAFDKALLGATRPLKALGIGKDGFVATGNRATDFANLMVLVGNKTAGAAAAFGQTLPGQLAIMQASLQDVKSEFGTALLPVATDVVGFGAHVLEGVNKVVSIEKSAAGYLSSGFGSVDVAAKKSTDSIGTYTDATDAYVLKAGKLSTAFAQGAIDQTQYSVRLSAAGVAVQKVGDASGQAASATTLVGQVTKAAQGYVDALATSEGTLGNAAATTAAALNTQYVAQLQLSNSFLGIRGALLNTKTAALGLSAAQAKVNEDVAKGLKGTDQYKTDLIAFKTAQDGTIASQIGLRSSVVQYGLDLQKSGHTQSEISAKILEFAAAAGFSRKEAERLVGGIKGIRKSQQDLANTEQPKFTFTKDGLLALSTGKLDAATTSVRNYIKTTLGVPVSQKAVNDAITGLGLDANLSKPQIKALDDQLGKVVINADKLDRARHFRLNDDGTIKGTSLKLKDLAVQVEASLGPGAVTHSKVAALIKEIGLGSGLTTPQLKALGDMIFHAGVVGTPAIQRLADKASLFKDVIHGSEGQQAKTTSLVEAYGRANDLTKGQVDNLITKVQGLVDKENSIPKHVSTKFDVDTSTAVSKIASLRSSIAETQRLNIAPKVDLSGLSGSQRRRVLMGGG